MDNLEWRQCQWLWEFNKLFKQLVPITSSYAAVDMREDNVMDLLKEFYEKPKDTLPMWVSLVTGECTLGECPAFFKTLNLVSDIVKL
jgi:hypothetical protein